MRNLLLLGGNGFIGKNLQQALSNANIAYMISDITFNNQYSVDLSTSQSIDVIVNALKYATDIVVLACTVGTDAYANFPFKSYQNNIQILLNVVAAINTATEKYSKKYNVIYFSSSDVYVKTKSYDEIITEKTPISIDTTRQLALYGNSKIAGEIMFERLYSNKIIKSLKILRPFNISGKYQSDGVVYKMIKSALINKTISYDENVSRVITSVEYLCNKFISILQSSKRHLIKNIADNNGSTMLKDLAYEIKFALENKLHINNIKLVGKYLEYSEFRHTSIPNAKNLRKIILPIIDDVLLNINITDNLIY